MSHPSWHVSKSPFSLGEVPQPRPDRPDHPGLLEEMPEPSLRQELRNLLQDYLQNPCIHGVSYLVDQSLSGPARLFWRFLMIACVVGFVAVGRASIAADQQGSLKRETVISVQETTIDTRELAFPSVTVCPVSNIRKSVALDFLRKHALVANFSSSEEELLHELLVGLQDFRYPWYSLNSLPDMNRIKFRLLDAFNLTHFMIQVLPTCEEMMSTCIIHEQTFDCCSQFRLQATNFGFCYAYNSCTSVGRSERGKCVAKRNGKRESFAMYVPLLHLNASEFLTSHPKRGGYFVVATNPHDIPQPMNGVFVDPGNPRFIKILMSATVQSAGADVRAVSPRTRMCRFATETLPALPLSHLYTEESCIETCRLQLIATVCGCIPYHFTADPRFPLSRYPVCSIYDIDCVSNNHELRSYIRDGFYRGNERRYWKGKAGLPIARNSCDCLPNCDFMFYDSEIETDGKVINKIGGIVSVQLRGGGKGMVYKMRLRRSLSQYIGNWGNIACLFLGVSVLSFVELLYIFGVGVSIIVKKARVRKVRTDTKQPVATRNKSFVS